MNSEQLIDLRPYLPAIYHPERDREPWYQGDPIMALLYVLGQTCWELDQRIRQVPSCFDPRTAPYADAPDADFLGLLGAWTALDLADLLPSETDQRVPAAGRPAAAGKRESDLRQLVLNVAALHRSRGTLTGLKLAIWLLFHVDPEIVEWAWPSGLQVGVSAMVGRDSMLTAAQNFDDRMVIFWKTEAVDSAKSAGQLPDQARAGHWLWADIEVLTELGSKRGQQLLSLGPVIGQDAPGLTLLITELRRLRELLRRELPATVDVFVVLGSPAEAAEAEIRPFLLEVDKRDQERFSSTVNFARLATPVTEHA
jgi:phage tail-like protein